jgi:AcrR family transcriptional regulator
MSARADRGTDPRIARSRIVILQAAVDELADHGYGGVTIEGVAARAGVAKSTIYRHWADRLELIADAFETFHERMVPDTTGSPPRETIATLLTHVAEVVTDSTFSRCIPALIEGAERDPRVRDFHHRYSALRRGVLVELVDRGVREGTIARDVDPELATAALLGAIFYRRLMTAVPLAPAEADRLVRTVLGAPLTPVTSAESDA